MSTPDEISSKPIAMRVDYRKINPKCYVCDGVSKVVRIMQATDGELYVATLCSEHTKGEQEHNLAQGDLQNIEGTGTFINMGLYERMLESGGVEQITAVVDEEVGRQKGAELRTPSK